MTAPIAQRLQDALMKHQAGDLTSAQAEYEAILNEHPECSQAWHLLGLVALQAGDPAQALAHIGRSISLDSTQAVYLNNYGAALLSAGKWAEARDSFQRAISIREDYADAYLNLGRAEQRLNQSDAAAWAYQQAIHWAPQNLEAHRLLAGLLFDLGAEAEAIEVYQDALALAPDEAALWNDLANAYSSTKRFDEAIQAYRKAIDLAPQLAESWFNLGSSLALSQDFDASRSAIQSAIRLRPDRTEWQLRETLLCPPVFASATQVESYYDSLLPKLRTLAGDLRDCDGDRLVSAGICPPLTVAFQGHDNRLLKETLASIVRPIIPDHRPRQRTSKPRVGFVVTRGHAALFVRCCQGLIERLDDSAFDLFIFCSTACTAFLRERIRREGLTVVEFADHFSAAVESISAAQCDVLYHWEVGTDSLNFLLPLARLAPVQCTSWGTQVTSGLHEVDYYLSSGLIESAVAERFCTEQLMRLNSLPTYQRRVNKPKLAASAEFGLADSSHVYLCPQNLLKLHPDQDDLFNAILDADPAGIIVLKETDSPAPGRELRKRFRETMPQNADRVHFVPWQTSADYYRLLTVADVVLDPIYYSAGSSAYDLFSLDLPVVTLPGERNVSRYTQACYQRMGFTELVAADRQQYVNRAIQVATDCDYREHARREISERGEVLFESVSAVTELHDVLAKMVAEARSR